jgi:flagellar hook-associated protein 1 FlgK
MTLTSALDVALSGLLVTSSRTSVVSRNIVNAGQSLASRKLANVVTAPDGGVRLASITRAADSALLAQMLAANSATGQQRSIVEALDRLDGTVLDPELDASPAALIGKLMDSIQIYSAAPHDTVAAQSAIAAARDLTHALNSATDTVQRLRQEADAEIASTVSRLNGLLAQFETVNTAIVNGTRSGADITDHLDHRDRLLLAISEEVGIRTMMRSDNDMVIFTDSGVTLFETKARAITFEPTLIYTASTTGHPVFADGVQITGAASGMVIGSGRLAGLMTIRDEIATTYQNQLDEIARGLMEAFAESDQSASPTLPDAPGLFTYAGATSVPPSGTIMTGLAGMIIVNPSADPAQGGDVTKLRDGGMNRPEGEGLTGDEYVYNPDPGGLPGFSDRLQELIDRMAEQMGFNKAAQLGDKATLPGFAASSIAWLQEARSAANSEMHYRATLFERTSEALSNATGVNLDHEMTLLLDLERSYMATSRLISVIDEMFRALLAATR